MSFGVQPRRLQSVLSVSKSASCHSAFQRLAALDGRKLLYDLKGFVILSGYPSDVYAELFERRGWRRVDRLARVMGGGVKTECLWLSPRTARALKPLA